MSTETEFEYQKTDFYKWLCNGGGTIIWLVLSGVLFTFLLVYSEKIQKEQRLLAILEEKRAREALRASGLDIQGDEIHFQTKEGKYSIKAVRYGKVSSRLKITKE